VAAALLLFISCGGSSSSDGGHPLEGSWLGLWLVSETEVTFDGQGTMTEFLLFGDPVTGFISGEVTSGGPEAYRLTLQMEEGALGGWFLVDDLQKHALFATDPESFNVPYFLGGLEWGAESLPRYGEDDIIGSWNGYSMSYSDQTMDLVITPAMSLVAVSGSPDNAFTLTRPNGSIILGNFEQTYSARYDGFAMGDYSVSAYMTPDKEFIALMAEQDLGDRFFYALTREP
jgi:hypothetical protein